ncbi:MAG: glycerol-3-phosphate 1-O-acyltransferase PlsY [Alphaproteobacteria bacterium]|nr:glycerol-3-phosphate 1-O-acyltransferase PlsY [Alphaproteobacteria bacterium]
MIRPDRARRPSHPGEMLKGLYLEERGIAFSLFAAAAGISRKHLSAIVNGRAAVSAATALRIGRLLGTSPDVWLRLQAAAGRSAPALRAIGPATPSGGRAPMPDPISWSHAAPYFLAALAGGYLLGSIPWGVLLTRAAGLGDIRAIGSGNIGATNVLRTGRKGLAAATLILDGLKGTVAVLLAREFGPDCAVIAALGALLGHMFPVWLRFKGGKGVATTIGLWFGLAWPVGLAMCGLWLAVAGLLRISSLSALVAVAASPVLAWHLADPQRAELGILVAVLVFVAHRSNIGRLLRGTEPRIGQKAPGPGAPATPPSAAP